MLTGNDDIPAILPLSSNRLDAAGSGAPQSQDGEIKVLPTSESSRITPAIPMPGMMLSNSATMGKNRVGIMSSIIQPKFISTRIGKIALLGKSFPDDDKTSDHRPGEMILSK